MKTPVEYLLRRKFGAIFAGVFDGNSSGEYWPVGKIGHKVIPICHQIALWSFFLFVS